MSDLKVMVQWFKLPSNPAMPARKLDVIERYKQTKLRTVQDVTYRDDDDAKMAGVPDVELTASLSW
jgi:hypothetical protein